MAAAPRVHVALPLAAGASVELPPEASRHVQVLRLQPGDALVLFNGEGGEWAATVERMGRQSVDVQMGAHQALEREAPRAVHLAVGVPANERMDWLVEKATELGVASIQPLQAQRSVVRLAGERAAKRQAHWQGIAVAACEQSGRNRVPVIHPVRELRDWIASAVPGALLSLAPDAVALNALAARSSSEPIHLLSGPEGGLSPEEEALARQHGWQPLTLGPRVLRADTAPLAALAALTL